jgi:hypothetical protein
MRQDTSGSTAVVRLRRSLASLAGAFVLVGLASGSAFAADLARFELPRAYCFGQHAPASEAHYIVPTVPHIWAMDYRPRVADKQAVSYQYLRYRLVNGTWQYDNWQSSWAAWYWTFDADSLSAPNPFHRPLSTVNVPVPNLTQTYAVGVRVYWYNSGTVPRSSYSSVRLATEHMTDPAYGWLSTQYQNINGCDYTVLEGNVGLPGPIFN